MTRGMRNMMLSALALIALVACGGPSGRDVSMAKQARYQGDKIVLFNAAKAVVESKYKLEKSDETTLGMQTKGKWYTPEGLVSPGGDDNMRDTPDRSIRVTLIVRLLPDGDNWIVQVESSMLRYLAGSPQPEKLSESDASVPGWAHGQVDELQYAIYDALKPYQVRSPGGIAPAPTPTATPPGAMPDESNAPGANPGAGSGAPPPTVTP